MIVDDGDLLAGGDVSIASAQRGLEADVALGVRSATVSRSADRVVASKLGADDVEAERALMDSIAERDDALARFTLQARRRAVHQAKAAEAAEAAERAKARAAAQWVAPMTTYDITATFGQSSSLWSTVHTGIDLAAPTGTAIVSTATGVVTFAGYDGSYGNKVVVTHSDGTETWYAHMDTIAVAAGQSVTAGGSVGTVGATGNVTGPHLHLEVRPGGGDPVDPTPALAARGVYL
ncbi:M23 family metallopeptidase [Nocardioides sp. SOB77]|uniref:M23 family metallopeptidase n=1 Tax=Nocardioides oceani TaxID=3058369 RepID=A0ABT8FM95_9ACTN|nr:M23 family metallopeptidase [Nocardioides oceani]MDN4175789.1 M23 family metallopeptidase [Nocardioides oceani]